MPKSWYDWNTNKVPKEEDSESEKNIKKEFNKTILADRKPYFMKYVYPSEKTNFDKYVKTSNEKALVRFSMSLDELIQKPDKNEEELRFVECYYQRLPLGVADCTINRICRRIEKEYDGRKLAPTSSDFDYTILKCDDVEYSQDLFNKVKTLYESYKNDLAKYCQRSKIERIKEDDRRAHKYMLTQQFRRKCAIACPNEEQLCNIVLDLCYSRSNASKQFAWDICGRTFIQNLLKRHNYVISYPTKDPNGDIEFGGEHFSMVEVSVRRDEDIEDSEWE